MTMKKRSRANVPNRIKQLFHVVISPTSDSSLHTPIRIPNISDLSDDFASSVRFVFPSIGSQILIVVSGFYNPSGWC